ncbi:class I SAM-dependent methyltransferase [Nocardia sp. bgisy118]|uniref:class I SAM-dependent methyltransferase n=1 Tax=Nocardia sp. bgisy118 TaxID=3413786 RepID=UPI003F4A7201
MLGFSNRFAWRCPTSRLLDHYNQHVSASHLDVGVGTGYYVANCRYPATQPRIGLMDINRHSLNCAARAASRYTPEIHEQNVLEQIQSQIAPFDSIGLTYLLHCLPGTIADKCVVFDHLMPLLAPGGTVFGATVVAESDGPHNAIARYLLREYNLRGHFHNTTDRTADLYDELLTRFHDVDIRRSGSVALFAARRPRRES